MSGVSVVEQRRDVGGWLRRWHPEVAARAVANGDWPNRTVADFARERVAAHPHKIHIFDGERQLSGIALYQYVQRISEKRRVGYECVSSCRFWWSPVK